MVAAAPEVTLLAFLGSAQVAAGLPLKLQAEMEDVSPQNIDACE